MRNNSETHIPIKIMIADREKLSDHEFNMEVKRMTGKITIETHFSNSIQLLTRVKPLPTNQTYHSLFCQCSEAQLQRQELHHLKKLSVLEKEQHILGIFGGAPRSPYPKSAGITSFLISPTHMLKIDEFG
jgi:hypothetical protein